MLLSVQGLAVRSLLMGVLGVFCAGCGSIAESRWTYHCEAPVSNGGACFGDWECATGLRCRANRCEPTGNLRDTCDGVNTCASGLSCHMEYTNSGECMATTCSEAGRDTGNCVQTRSTGRPCAADLTCPPLEVCAVTSSARGECRAIPGEGESCDGFVNFSCQPGLICELRSFTCKRPVVGGICGAASEDITSSCGESLGCDARVDGSNICTARVGPGGACNTESCQAGYHCDSSTRRCERDLEEGDRCVNGNECGVRFGRQVDCVARECRRVDREGAVCWPGQYGCVGGLRCLKDR